MAKQIRRGCNKEAQSRNITAERIKPMIPDANLKHKDGVVTWWLANYTDDIDKFEQVVAFKDIFMHYERENFPLRYESVKTKQQADIKIYFVQEDGLVVAGEETFMCPINLSDDVLAAAYAPYGGEWQGYVFVNDNLFWELKDGDKEDRHNLVSTLIHEIGHTFNMDHSSNPKDIMYYMEQDGQEWGDDSIGLLFNLYKDERINALKKNKSALLLFNEFKVIKNAPKARELKAEKESTSSWYVVAFILGLLTMSLWYHLMKTL